MTRAAWVVLAMATIPLTAQTFHLSPDGDDGWSGTLAEPNAAGTDGPWRTLAGARDNLRRVRRPGEPVTVMLADGVYRQTEPVTFGPLDGGTAGAPVRYAAAPGAVPRLSGGVPIAGWQVTRDGAWRATVPADQRFEQLWVNGRRAVPARSPNRFYYHVTGKVPYAVDPATGQPAQTANRAFRGRPEDLAPLVDLSPAELERVTVVAYQSWEHSRHKIASLSADGTVLLTGDASWPFSQWGPHQRYHLEGFRAALDQPGEWCQEPDGTIWYLPREGETPAAAEVIAPVAQQLVRVVGDADLGLTVDSLEFAGLTFEYTGWWLPERGHSDGQAAQSIPAVIQVDAATDLRLTDCTVRHTGIWAVWLHRAVRGARIERCYLHDLGAGGVRLGQGWAASIDPPDVRTAGNTVDNCIIRNGGRIHLGSVGVWIGHTPDNAVTHNDIADFFYTGVSVGWVWGYGESVAVRNTIEYNHIHHLGWGVLSDMGGVYSLGVSPGTSVSFNHIHDVWSYDRYGRGGWGLYTDEGSSQMVLEGNLVHDVKTGTFHQHYGRDNLVRNNILAYSSDGQLQRSRAEEHRSFTFERNIVIWDRGDVFSAGSWNTRWIDARNNLYWRRTGDVRFGDLSLEQLQQQIGIEQGSLVADPRLGADPADPWRPAADSPALALGFEPLDWRSAGVYGEADWVALADAVDYPPVEFAPDPPPSPPVSFTEDFDLAPLGSQPLCDEVYTEGAATVAVSDEQAASGRQSLKVTDAAGLQHEYDPHFAWRPRHVAGVTTLRFKLRLAPRAKMYTEWRTWPPGGYHVGPTMTFDDGRLIVPGQPPLAVPADTWIAVTVISPVGRPRGESWTLRVEIPGRAPEEMTVPLGDADFTSLDWLGFCSTATQPTAYYLDDIELTNAPEEDDR